MYLTFGDVVSYTPISINRKKKQHVHVQNCPCGPVCAKIGYELGLLVYVKVVVEFGRKLFLVDCLSRKTFNMAKIKWNH